MVLMIHNNFSFNYIVWKFTFYIDTICNFHRAQALFVIRKKIIAAQFTSYLKARGCVTFQLVKGRAPSLLSFVSKSALNYLQRHLLRRSIKYFSNQIVLES